MKLVLEMYKCLCSTKTFSINDIPAQSSDFGNQEDEDSYSAESYGCGDMRFTPKLATEDVLEKYQITVSEYNLVASQLEKLLSFGCCGWCV